MGTRRRWLDASAIAMGLLTLVTATLLFVSTTYRMTVWNGDDQRWRGIGFVQGALICWWERDLTNPPGRYGLLDLVTSRDEFGVLLMPAIERYDYGPKVGEGDVTVPFWILLPLMAAWPVYWFARRRRPQYQIGFCEGCGYDLRGRTDPNSIACPECGATVEALARTQPVSPACAPESE